MSTVVMSPLARAERSARLAAAGSMGVSPRELTVLLTEYDRMRRELDRHHAVRRELWEIVGRTDGTGMDLELIDAVSDLKHPAGGTT